MSFLLPVLEKNWLRNAQKDYSGEATKRLSLPKAPFYDLMTELFRCQGGAEFS